MSEEKCPQCGAAYLPDAPYEEAQWRRFVCDTTVDAGTGDIYQSEDCKDRQIAALEAQVKELEAERVALIKWVRTMIPSGKVLWKALCYDGRGR